MATIRKRGIDRWQAQVRLQGHAPFSKTFRSRKDAIAWARTTENALIAGTLVTKPVTDSIPLKDCLQRYLDEITPSKKGRIQEASRIRSLIGSPLAGKEIVKISSSDIASHRDQRLQLVGPATVVRELATLSHVFTIARSEWGFESLPNPVKDIRRPKLPRGRTRRLSTEELDRLLLSTESKELATFVRLAVETALRRSELCRLEWKHIDLQNRCLLVTDSKNGSSRTIPLSEASRTLIESLSEQRHGKVFTLRPDSVTQAFRRACERAKLPDLRLHDCRHEAASRFFEKGLNVIEAASITGHKDLRMLNRYVHLNVTKLAAKLDNLVA